MRQRIYPAATIVTRSPVTSGWRQALAATRIRSGGAGTPASDHGYPSPAQIGPARRIRRVGNHRLEDASQRYLARLAVVTVALA
jgi:hypothetical protein